jgi:hypothetical protein
MGERGKRLHSNREARLRLEYAPLYPYLVAGEWEPAAVVTDRVVANVLGRPGAHFITGERALDPSHFEFRGSHQHPTPEALARDRRMGARPG